MAMWSDNSDHIAITGCETTCTQVEIPPTIEGDSVTEVAPAAFANQVLNTISLPSTLTNLNSDSFGSNRLPISRLSGFQPQITGTPKVGSPLTVSSTAWLGTATKQYSWLRNGQVIAGATSARYVPTIADFGKSISARVVLRRSGYVSTTMTSSEKSILAGDNPLSPRPGVSGVYRVGQVLTAKPGTWSSGTQLQYQWLRNGQPIPEATASTYQVEVADLGQRISIRVIGSNYGYLDRTLTSSSYSVSLGIQAPISGLAIQGNGLVGQTLSVPTQNDLSYQWLRNSIAIPGAVGSSYMLTNLDFGKVISLRATRKQPGYLDAFTLIRFSSTIKR